MSRSGQLRMSDIRAVYRLIGDCRDLGADPVLWHGRMLEGLVRLIGASAATGGEGRWPRPGRSVSPASAFSLGLDSAARERYERYTASLRKSDLTNDTLMKRLSALSGPLVVRTRSQLVGDGEWYRSLLFNDYLKTWRLNHNLLSVCEVTDDHAVSVVALYRGQGERDFSDRDQNVLRLFHEELGRLIGSVLVSAYDPDPLRLPRRERETLACLLQGDSEKQVAARLNVSHATAHQYVTSLYRRFRVRSRAELLAYFLRRLHTRLRSHGDRGLVETLAGD